MAEDRSREIITGAGAGHSHSEGAPECPSGNPAEIDMSAFEEMYAGRSATAPHRNGDQSPDLAGAQSPGVEWAIRWADGRQTPVSGENAARRAADRLAGCQAVCRIVGPWAPA